MTPLKLTTARFICIVFALAGFMLLPAGKIYAQNESPSRPLTADYKGIIFNKEFTVEGRLHTNGFTLGANFGKIVSYYKTPFYHISIGELKHPKEVQQSEIYNFGPGHSNRSFVFGKQNTFLLLRGGIGNKRYYSEKASKKGLAIGISWEAGPTLGILKPYYLRLREYAEPGALAEIVERKYSPDIENLFLDIYSIEGSSGFGKGLGELSVIPGIHARGGVHFDWGAFDEFVKAGEAGIMIDVFPKKVPMMVTEENSRFFINLYISFLFGKRS